MFLRRRNKNFNTFFSVGVQTFFHFNPHTLQKKMAEPQKDFIQTAKSLIGAKAMLDARDNAGRTAFHVACSRGNLDMIKLLLEAGSDPNTVDNQGFTPLHTATQEGHADAETIAYLLQASSVSGKQ
jgi:ankyrin repeat protein